MAHNPELDYEYREDKPRDDAQKRAATASLFYMETPSSNPMVNDFKPADAEQMTILRQAEKKPWKIFKSALIAIVTIAAVFGLFYLLRVSGLFPNF